MGMGQTCGREIGLIVRLITQVFFMFFFLAAQNVRSAEPKEGSDPSTTPSSESRTWIDSTGDHETDARFGGIESGKVKLIKSDGTEIELPLEKLSRGDRHWIADRGKTLEEKMLRRKRTINTSTAVNDAVANDDIQIIEIADTCTADQFDVEQTNLLRKWVSDGGVLWVNNSVLECWEFDIRRFPT